MKFYLEITFIQEIREGARWGILGRHYQPYAFEQNCWQIL